MVRGDEVLNCWEFIDEPLFWVMFDDLVIMDYLMYVLVDDVIEFVEELLYKMVWCFCNVLFLVFDVVGDD